MKYLRLVLPRKSLLYITILLISMFLIETGFYIDEIFSFSISISPNMTISYSIFIYDCKFLAIFFLIIALSLLIRISSKFVTSETAPDTFF